MESPEVDMISQQYSFSQITLLYSILSLLRLSYDQGLGPNPQNFEVRCMWVVVVVVVVVVVCVCGGGGGGGLGGNMSHILPFLLIMYLRPLRRLALFLVDTSASGCIYISTIFVHLYRKPSKTYVTIGKLMWAKGPCRA